jgi:hypothetical protein
MIPLSSAISRGLTWSKIQCGRGYELTLDGNVVGTLRRPGFWSQTFLAETQQGQWKFCRSGFLCNGAEIVDAVSGQPVANFNSSWSGNGNLIFADGQSFRFECKGWWHPVWSVLTDSGQPVLRLHVREKTVELPEAVTMADGRLYLLALFARYRMLQTEEDAASATTVAVIAAS